MLRKFLGFGGAPVEREKYARASAELYQLGLHGVLLPKYFVVSPGSEHSAKFTEEIAILIREMQDAGDSPSAVRSVRERLSRTVTQFSRWQNGEFDQLLDRLTASVRRFADSLHSSLGDQEEVLGHMGELQENLQIASEATSLEQAQQALRVQARLLQRALEHQHKIQRGLRQEYEESLRVLEDQVNAAEAVSRTDKLTNLSNRAAFDDHLADVLQRVRNGEGPFSIAVFDLDGFKAINERLGREAGDIAMKEFASALKSIFAKHGFIARFGGDEFVVLVKWSEQQLQKLAQQFQVAIVKRPITTIPGDAGSKVTLATSVGVATLREHDTAASLLVRADESLEDMKKRFGGGRAA